MSAGLSPGLTCGVIVLCVLVSWNFKDFFILLKVQFINIRDFEARFYVTPLLH